MIYIKKILKDITFFKDILNNRPDEYTTLLLNKEHWYAYIVGIKDKSF